MFTERHFNAIAHEMRETRPADHGWQTTESFRVWRGIVITFADRFAADNDRFKRPLFYKACGLDPARLPRVSE